MSKRKIIISLLVISLLGNVLFFYKWQQQASIIEQKHMDFLDKTVHLKAFSVDDHSIFSRQRLGMLHRLSVATSGVSYATQLYEVDSPITLEVTKTLTDFERILNEKYIPVVQKINHSEEPISKEDKQMLLQLGNHYEKADFPESKKVSTIGLATYMESVNKFIELEKEAGD
ncbi:hypothetical protein SAMN04487936_104332 [Halobacillus dabanensis]|uniref:Uncharacterized protein n=1 Tax=Halobacillus dabanensis TaxID=240302 RepID=A0A1I3UHX7_HALDA|nr:hypothetical protein [Halobacillus dabanensis]SFJ82465.1 hypothetical protein SAMN04487936_104332 [Halobacillus dabanensis]